MFTNSQAFSLRTYYNSEQQNLRKITQILETQTGKIVDVSLAYIFPGIEDVEQFPKGTYSNYDFQILII